MKVLSDELKGLMSIDLPKNMHDLLAEVGLVIGPGKKSSTWILYPIINCRPQQGHEVKGDWKNWLAETSDGQSLIASLKDSKKMSDEHPESLEITKKNFAKVNAAIWLIFVNKGRSSRCFYVPTSELPK
jgi:hypothetical protein